MNNRIYRYFFRANEEENRKIEMLYKLSKMNSYSAFFRKMIINKNPIIIDTQSFLKANYELNRIGNNINQIAKKINTYNYIEKQDLQIVKNSLEEISKTQEKLFNKVLEITNGTN